MDKLLAMSILSSTPAEIAGFWGAAKKKALGGQVVKDGQSDAKMNRDMSKDKEPQRRRPEETTHFSLGFDGLNFFETIISR